MKSYLIFLIKKNFASSKIQHWRLKSLKTKEVKSPVEDILKKASNIT